MWKMTFLYQEVTVLLLQEHSYHHRPDVKGKRNVYTPTLLNSPFTPNSFLYAIKPKAPLACHIFIIYCSVFHTVMSNSNCIFTVLGLYFLLSVQCHIKQIVNTSMCFSPINLSFVIFRAKILRGWRSSSASSLSPI